MAVISDRMDEAIKLASLSFFVIPLWAPSNGICTCNKKAKCTKPGKHPKARKDWQEDATRDPETIRSWFERSTATNVGIVTGARSNVVVLDLDGDPGRESLAALEAEYGALPETVQVITGGGGLHYYFEHPGCRIPNSAGRIGPGVDIRGDGGYVVTPTSCHVNGNRYEWEAAHHIDDAPFSPMPQWLIALAIESAQKSVSQTLASGEVFIPGTRNDALFRIASFMCSGNMSEGMILGALRAANDERCNPPLDDDEVKRIAANAVRLYRKKAPINVLG